MMNICFILPLHALKYTCPLPQSVLHIATYGPFTMTVQSQPPASLKVGTCHLSKKLITASQLQALPRWNTQTLHAHKPWE